jgi:hypothetical protein
VKRLAIIAASGLAMAAAANPVAQWFHFGDAAVAAGEWYTPYATTARGIWSLDKGTANDFGPFGYHGAVSNGAAFVDGGMDFDGVNDFIQLPTNLTPNAWGAATVAMKLKRDVNTINLGMFGSYTASSYFFVQNGITWSGLPAIGAFGGAAFAELINTNIAPANTTNVIVWVFDGAGTNNATRLRLYINGTNYVGLSFSTTVGTNIPPANFAGLRIGAVQGLSRYWNGTISRVMLTDTALSSNDVTTLTERMWMP